MLDPTDTSFRRGLRLGVGLVAVGAAVFVLWRAWTVVEALFIAMVLSTALWPWVSRLSRGSGGALPRPVAVAAIFIAAFGTIAGLLWLAVLGAVPILDRVAAEMPGVAGPIRDALEPFRSGDLGEGARQVVEEATNGAPLEEGQTDAAALALAAAGGATTALLVVAFTLFLLIEGDRYAGWAFMILPKERRASARALAVAVRDRLSGWVVGWIGYAFATAFLVGAIMFALQVPTPWLFGVLAFIFALVPGLGVVLAFVPAAVLASGGPPWQTMAVIVAAALYHATDVMYLSPKLHAGVLQLPTFVGVVAVLVGVAIFGIWGGLIAAPVAAVIAMTLNETLRPHARAA